MASRQKRVSAPIGRERWELLRQAASQLRMSMAELLCSLIDWSKLQSLMKAKEAERDAA